MPPDLKEEKKLKNKGYQYIVGLDEVGRGPLAGPVLAAAVAINPKFFPCFTAKNSELKIKDSKQLTPKKREEFYKILVENSHIKWGVGKVSEKVIDKINILEATKLAMNRAIAGLGKKLAVPNSYDRRNLAQPDFLILDGNFKINTNIPQKSIVKADEKVFSCAAASIIAKVTRDRLMLKYHQKYPQYGFDRHKGYPTKFHRKMIKKYGFCQIHRKTFRVC